MKLCLNAFVCFVLAALAAQQRGAAGDGKEVNLSKDVKTITVLKGDTFVVKRGDKVIAAGRSKVDRGKNPMALESTYTEGADKGKTFKGISRLEGDTLRFCRAGSPDDPTPTEFKTTPGSGAFVSVYKRAKP